jgi:hypothetical protein
MIFSSKFRAAVLSSTALATLLVTSACTAPAPVQIEQGEKTNQAEPPAHSVSLNLTTQTIEADFCDFDNAPSAASCRETSRDDFQSASATPCAIDTVSPPPFGKAQWPSSETWDWAPVCARGTLAWPSWSVSSANYVMCSNRLMFDFGGLGETSSGKNDDQVAEVFAKAGQTVFELRANYEFPGVNTVVGNVTFRPEGPVEIRLEVGNEDGTWRRIAWEAATTPPGRFQFHTVEVRADVYDPGTPVRLVVVGAAGLPGEAKVLITRARLSVPTCVRDEQGACR